MRAKAQAKARLRQAQARAEERRVDREATGAVVRGRSAAGSLVEQRSVNALQECVPRGYIIIRHALHQIS